MPRAKTGIRTIGGNRFLLRDEVDSYIVAQVTAAVYRSEGQLCRTEAIWKEGEAGCYRIWVGPRRQRRPVLIPGDNVKRGFMQFKTAWAKRRSAA